MTLGELEKKIKELKIDHPELGEDTKVTCPFAYVDEIIYNKKVNELIIYSIN